MGKPTKRTISASEIGAYLYCQRSWGYQRLGMPTANVEELARGEVEHEQHVRQVVQTQSINRLGLVLAGLAVLILLFSLLP